jgi:hypothetical protein
MPRISRPNCEAIRLARDPKYATAIERLNLRIDVAMRSGAGWIHRKQGDAASSGVLHLSA